MLRDPVKRMVSAWKHGARIRKVPDAPVSLAEAIRDRPMLGQISRYSAQTARYLEHFPRDQILIVDFRALTENPQAEVDRCCAFLGIDTPPRVETIEETQQHAAHDLTPLGKIVARRMKRHPGLSRLIRSVVPETLRRSVKTELKPVEFNDLDVVARDFGEENEFIRTALQDNPF